ncbi:MAG: hypothetical protein ACYSUC_03915 [Planctomycetota bacterium]|jgi:hypothetical protein
MKREPPVGFKIQVEQSLRGTAYSWKDEETTPAKFRRVVLHLLMVCAAAFLAFFVLSELTSGSTEAPPRFLWIVFAICIIMVLANVFLVYSTLKGRKPFVLTLSPGRIHYQMGSIGQSTIDKESSNIRSLNQAMTMCKKYSRRNLDMDASKIVNLRLERAGERQSLCFDYEGDSLEIGQALSEPEREWLYGLLREHCGIA